MAQAATKSCGRNVQLPAADDHRCSTSSTRGRLCQIRASPVAKLVERHHFLCLLFAARNSPSFRHSTLFDSGSPRQAIHQHQHIPLTYGPHSSLNMAHLMHRSVYSQDIHTLSSLHRCRPDLDLRRKEAWQSLGS